MSYFDWRPGCTCMTTAVFSGPTPGPKCPTCGTPWKIREILEEQDFPFSYMLNHMRKKGPADVSRARPTEPVPVQ